MPKKIKKVLIIGSGPIVIGQAAEFDYSGSQACKALREEGIFTILVNSNPATIQTDFEVADQIYIEPLTVDVLTKIIEKERPDALLPTMGGQTGLNLGTELAKLGILKKFKVKVIGTSILGIKKGEDREEFKKTMERIGQPIPKSQTVNSIEEALKVAENLGYPVIIRPAYCLGGTGSGIAYNEKELREIGERGLNLSLIKQVLIEECVLGWAEIEYEVVRDSAGKSIIVCPMENVDPMGIHTGDSIVVAPLLSVSKKEDKMLRRAAIEIVDALNIQGACNIQFALNQGAGEYRVIEVNPRASRSSALASKATAYPIARVATKIATGKKLEEIYLGLGRNAFFEPSPDYVVVKIPRWPFDKISDANPNIGTQMKATGEVMAIGKNFEEALQKAIRSLEIGKSSLYDKEISSFSLSKLEELLLKPTDKRIFVIAEALRKGMSVKRISELTFINSWFIKKIKNIIDLEKKPKKERIFPEFKAVAPYAAYFYSTFHAKSKKLTEGSDRKKAIVIGSGPIRIGQGIEFDYCCVHAVRAIKEEGLEAIMVNCNPETVSTDYDTADKLYFEPLTLEDVLNIYRKENPMGAIVQLGGQTPINICLDLEKNGMKILGTPTWAIDIAEDRDKFYQFAQKLKVLMPAHGIAYNFEEALKIAKNIGYPVIVRPSYVLGGVKMEIVYNEADLKEKFEEALRVWEGKPVLIDKFLENSKETEIDAIYDGKTLLIGGIMEHIEEAGVHSGDAACVTPPYSLSKKEIKKMVEYTKRFAKALNIIGLFNIQFAISNGKVYIFEVNPRASRTVPYLSKATGIPLAKIATKVILGRKLKELGFKGGILKPSRYAVKEAVLPFDKLLEADTVLGPEMKSTGEVMGVGRDFPTAFYKGELACGNKLPLGRNVFISIRKDVDPTKIAKLFHSLKFNIFATEGTGKKIKKAKIPVKILPKVSDIEKPNVLDYIINKEIDLVINLPSGKGAKDDEYKIRRAAIDYKIPYITTTPAALAAGKAIASQIKNNNLEVYPLLKRN
jgi:carbamoyl-phosphate synthase large subunit